MTHSVTGLSNSVKRGLAAAMLAGSFLGAPAAAQDQDEVVTGRSPDVRDVATTPMQDLNLMKDEVPEALKDAVIAPYASEKLVNCDAIRDEVTRLDRVLGDDLDIATDDRRDLTVGKVAKSAVGSLIPFRGIIREVSGAADRQRDFQEAILAGAIRRGFLKGLGEARECPYPARPAFMKIAIDRDDEVAYDDEANAQETAATPDPNNPF